MPETVGRAAGDSKLFLLRGAYRSRVSVHGKTPPRSATTTAEGFQAFLRIAKSRSCSNQAENGLVQVAANLPLVGVVLVLRLRACAFECTRSSQSLEPLSLAEAVTEIRNSQPTAEKRSESVPLEGPAADKMSVPQLPNR